MAHRGLDDRGLVQANFSGAFYGRDPKRNDIGVESNSVMLGPVRFSLVDLTSAGHQPFVIEGENIIVTFNGEIYSYAELKNELFREGYVFKTNGDTEILALASRLRGVDCF